jgi:hypothetical protein
MNATMTSANQDAPTKPHAKPLSLERMVRRLEALMLEQLVKRCPHDSRYVSADILEGGMNNGYTQLQLCRRCGAVRFAFGDHSAGEQLRYQEWRRPRPLWV